MDPLQEGGAVAAAAVSVLEQLVVHAQPLLGDKLKTLPPLPQAVEGLGKHTLHCTALLLVLTITISITNQPVTDDSASLVIADLAAAQPQHQKRFSFFCFS